MAKKQLHISGTLFTYLSDLGQIDPRVMIDDVEIARAIIEFVRVDTNEGNTGRKIRIVVEIDDYETPRPTPHE